MGGEGGEYGIVTILFVEHVNVSMGVGLAQSVARTADDREVVYSSPAGEM